MDPDLFTAPSNWYYSFTITWGETTGSQPSPYCKLYKNNAEFLSVSENGSITIRAFAGDVFTYARVNRKYTISATADFYSSKWGSSTAKPRELETIWKQIRLTLFGIHIDNSNFVGIESSSVVTWSLTPWNFVWYVKLGNYKIPYYL